jgi:arylsulfatase A-like enzyme
MLAPASQARGGDEKRQQDPDEALSGSLSMKKQHQLAKGSKPVTEPVATCRRTEAEGFESSSTTNDKTKKQLSRRDLLRCGLSFAAVSALSNTSVSALARLGPSMTQPQPASKPNIVFLLMDNLGYGEVGCYGGGITRGVPTPRIDKLATEGTRLTNFNVEAQCSPSRSAIMTGRFSIRSGTHSVPIGGGKDGLTQWEVTIAETLSAAGYATAHFGKWHLGSEHGRLPNDQGFDEWYGIPRTTDEALWPGEPAAKAAGVPFEHIMEGRKGEKSRELVVYDLDQRRQIDTEITRRTIDFMKRSVAANKPFYAYVPFTLVHFPTLPNPKFAGKTGYGDFPDALSEMDAHVGEILDAIDSLQIRDHTIVVFTSDNGPEATWPWQGSSGGWRGYYFTHMEGSLRAPFIIRWPNRIPAGRVSNEIVHEVDTFTTFAKIAGASLPLDRPIDGVDQTDFFFGKSEKSLREGFPVFVADRLEAIKWRNWKVVFYDEQRDWWTPPTKLGSPKAFNLITDPKEEYPQTGLLSSWIAGPAIKVMVDFEQSLKKYPPIAPGTPDPYKPPAR